MTQINRKTAIALAKEAGMAGMLTDVVCSLEEIHRLCNLAVAHSRKDAEPVAKIISSGPADFPLLQWLSADLSFREPIGSLLYAHPPEADKLLQQALELADLTASVYGLSDESPNGRLRLAIRTYLEGKKCQS